MKKNILDECWNHYEVELRKTGVEGVSSEVLDTIMNLLKQLYQAGASQGVRLILERPDLIPAFGNAIREFEANTGMPKEQRLAPIQIINEPSHKNETH